MLDQLGKSKYYTTLDLVSGYWQIKIHADSQEKTAFEFQMMPFGVMNAPAVFQWLMQRVLSGLQFASVYLDDVIVHSETLEEYVNHLKTIFERLKEAKLKLKPEKYKFVYDEVEYLGHVIDSSQMNKILLLGENFLCKHLWQFLGLTSHYRCFIHNYAKTAHPLHVLTRKGAQFQWTAECEVAFETLKDKLLTPPVLVYPKTLSLKLMPANRALVPYYHNVKKTTSIDVLPSKNQALCKYCILASKLKHC